MIRQIPSLVSHFHVADARMEDGKLVWKDRVNGKVLESADGMTLSLIASLGSSLSIGSNPETTK